MNTEATHTALSGTPLLSARHLSKSYWRKDGWSRSAKPVKALDDVSLSVIAGSTLAIIGESGAGKSTLGRCLASLEDPDSGDVLFEGRTIDGAQDLSVSRRRVQFIFQDASSAMNPRLSAAEIVEEPLQIREGSGGAERRRKTLELLERVGLSPDCVSRLPMELSGGQRRRLTIARALTLQPSVLILDEALTGVDLPLQAQIVNLLTQLKDDLGLTYICITHDLRLAFFIADHIAVMRAGAIVEAGPAGTVFFENPNPYVKLLLDAIPSLPSPAPLARWSAP